MKNQIVLRPSYWASVSRWSSNPKYDTEYRMKRVDDIINDKYDFNKKGSTEIWKIV